MRLDTCIPLAIIVLRTLNTYLTTLGEIGILPCTEHILLTARFAKSGSITMICLRTPQNPYYQPPCTAPTPLLLCFASVTHITKGGAATVACFEAVHMARGLAVPDFLRQITEER
jgi:hypothetical protein